MFAVGTANPQSITTADSVRLCAGAVGPALFGVLFDAWGDFRPVMLGALALPGVALVATCFLPRYPPSRSR